MPSPGCPRRSAGTAEKLNRARPRVGSSESRLFLSTPSACRSTMNRDALLPSRASTMAASAISPSVTGSFIPWSVPSSMRTWSIVGSNSPGPSAVAKHPINLPSVIFGSHLLCCALLPANNSAWAKKYRVDAKGTGANARPISSAIAHRSMALMPKPPWASGRTLPSQPISAICDQSAASWERLGSSSTARTITLLQRAERNLRASSLSRRWSAE